MSKSNDGCGRDLRACLLIVLMAVLPSCGGKSEDPANTLDIFVWSEYVPDELIDGFTRETGIKVNRDLYDSNEAMMSKLMAGSVHYDLIQPSDYAAEGLAKAGLLERIDASKIPNLKNVGPEFLRQTFDPRQEFTVPYMAGVVAIVVNTERVKEEVRGFKDVFQPRFQGRIVIVDDNREIVSWALATLGIGINDLTSETLSKARPVLAEWVKLVKVWDAVNPKVPLINGDADIGVLWSGDAARLIEESSKFKFVLPAEGGHFFIDSLAIPKGAPHREHALRFMDYCLRAESGKMISGKFPYLNPNLEARRLLTPAQLANPASYPSVKGLPTFRDIGKTAAEVDRMMTELRAGN